MNEGTRTERRAVLVNGQSKRVTAATLAGLLVELGYEPGRGGIAVALNGAVVPRGRWSTTELNDGDAVEVVGAVQGG